MFRIFIRSTVSVGFLKHRKRIIELTAVSCVLFKQNGKRCSVLRFIVDLEDSCDCNFSSHTVDIMHDFMHDFMHQGADSVKDKALAVISISSTS